MPSLDINRLEHASLHPRILDLHFALQRLRSTVSFMNSGAHPDDETSAMLAAIGFRDGLDISYVCANRGEGGQNNIGTESGSTLGTLRTAEMERAADALDMRLYWLSSHVKDTIFDFGFSKSGDETLAKWQHEHALNQFVSIVRREKPDILCPTFLDVPGQHGHHRAMTQLAHEVVSAAADANFEVEHNGQALPPWTIAKLYLPAWGGGGSSYDDELPPPNATLHVIANDIDEFTGWSWELIGQQSRRFHLSQGMGRWVAVGEERNWPLHLAHSIFSSNDDCVTANLPADLLELADYAKAPQINNHLVNAQQAIDEAIAFFPHFDKVLTAANIALVNIRAAQANCPDSAVANVQHRLARKISQLSRVIRIASGVVAYAVAEKINLRPGQETVVKLEVRSPTANASEKTESTVSFDLDDNWSHANNALILAEQSIPTNPYPVDFFPDRARKPALKIELNVGGVESHSYLSMVNTPLALPKSCIKLSSYSKVINRQSTNRTFSVAIEICIPGDAPVSIQAPEEWVCTITPNEIEIVLPNKVETGLYKLPLLIGAEPAQTEQIIDYPHTNSRVLVDDALISVLVLDVKLPDKRVAYIGGGNDRVAEYIGAMGVNIVEIDDQKMNTGEVLEQFDTLVVGIFAMRTRPVLFQNMAYIHRWIKNGGHLLTLYHRPWDNWDPQTVPPRFLEIGQPSLRFRVTDEQAAVRQLLPDHPLLNIPNKISADDWEQWQKERGLYFAKQWHKDYQALLLMGDPDEEPLTGGLLSAEIGLGRHTHTSLTLHHQMTQLVPGSFRLMANLIN